MWDNDSDNLPAWNVVSLEVEVEVPVEQHIVVVLAVVEGGDEKVDCCVS